MLGARFGNLGPLRRRFCDFYVRSHFLALFLAFASRESVLDVRVGGYNFGAILVGPICLGCNTKNAHPGPYFSDPQPCGVPSERIYCPHVKHMWEYDDLRICGNVRYVKAHVGGLHRAHVLSYVDAHIRANVMMQRLPLSEDKR